MCIQVRKLIAPASRIILCVEEFVDTQAATAERERNYLHNLIKEFDPHLSRTVFVNTKFYLLLNSFTSVEELNKQLV